MRSPCLHVVAGAHESCIPSNRSSLRFFGYR